MQAKSNKSSFLNDIKQSPAKMWMTLMVAVILMALIAGGFVLLFLIERHSAAIRDLTVNTLSSIQ